MLFQYQYYGGSGTLQNVLQLLNNWGFFDAFLPFLLIFTLLYVILKRTTGGTTVLSTHAGILSFTLSLLVVVPHVLRLYPPGQDPIIVMSQVLPQLVILLLAILMLLMLMGLIGSSIPNIMYTLISAAAIILLVLALVSAVFPAFAPSWLLGWFSDPNFIALIIIILTMGLVIYFVTADSTDNLNAQGKKKSFIERLDDFSEGANRIFGFGGSGGAKPGAGGGEKPKGG